MAQKNTKKKPVKKKNTVRRIIMIAIGISLLTIAYFGLKKQTTKSEPVDIFTKYYSPVPNTYYDVNLSSDSLMDAAFTAYEKGDFLEASKAIEKKLETSPSYELNFYLGQCYGQIGNYPLAIKNLESMKRFDTPYLDDAYWLLGFYFYKQNNLQFSLKNFQDFEYITKDPVRQQSAVEIIKILMEQMGI